MWRSPKAVMGWAAQAPTTRGRSGAARPGTLQATNVPAALCTISHALAHPERLLLARGQDELGAVLGKQQGQLLSQALGSPGQPDNLQAGAGCERSVQHS